MLVCYLVGSFVILLVCYLVGLFVILCVRYLVGLFVILCVRLLSCWFVCYLVGLFVILFLAYGVSSTSFSYTCSLFICTSTVLHLLDVTLHFDTAQFDQFCVF